MIDFISLCFLFSFIWTNPTPYPADIQRIQEAFGLTTSYLPHTFDSNGKKYADFSKRMSFENIQEDVAFIIHGMKSSGKSSFIGALSRSINSENIELIDETEGAKLIALKIPNSSHKIYFIDTEGFIDGLLDENGVRKTVEILDSAKKLLRKIPDAVLKRIYFFIDANQRTNYFIQHISKLKVAYGKEVLENVAVVMSRCDTLRIEKKAFNEYLDDFKVKTKEAFSSEPTILFISSRSKDRCVNQIIEDIQLTMNFKSKKLVYSSETQSEKIEKIYGRIEVFAKAKELLEIKKEELMKKIEERSTKNQIGMYVLGFVGVFATPLVCPLGVLLVSSNLSEMIRVETDPEICALFESKVNINNVGSIDNAINLIDEKVSTLKEEVCRLGKFEEEK
ncbi:hypothetical protein ROZALSC1DRAFT_28188 [Rozella allomycis CSF55]|uniref:G domain-containing protein n=1 Tax=Rozella allomycis (strain CSF55) TaxID=988480 RepID=A0A075AYM8_ROZAC|nr:hypothetical protein O9G_003684 [Rozella allomycis CSF55]RKP20313.1 hypothetical protein ROZALSC1DRAFT_28188 [Rozella allomycis CSF55]|eukprot:EPZ35425.1 hypothetical protein O9G_003684 [Rozella allomycis CSF55]